MKTAQWKAWCMVAAPAALLAILPFPGTVALRLTLLTITVVTAAAMWRRLAPPPLPCKLPIVLWAGVALLSVAWSFDPRYSLGELKNEVGYTLLGFIGFYVLAVDAAQGRRMLGGLAMGAAVMLGGAFVLQSGQRIWIEDTFVGGSGTFSTYLVVIAPLVLAPLLAAGRIGSAGVALGVVLFAGFLTGQKIFVAVGALEVALLLWLLSRARLVQWNRAWLAAAGVIGVIVLGLMLRQILINRAMTDNPLQDNMVQDVRVRQWPLVMRTILSHPLGAGFGREAMHKAYPDLLPGDVPLFWHAHNLFLNYGLEAGIAGMLVLLLVFAALLREFWRLCAQSGPSASSTQRVIGAAGFAMVAGVMARNMTNDFFMRDMSLLFWSLSGLLLGWGSRLATQVKPS
ncbi:MAG TPA: O-antigen ligase family protein [Burkholderiales bacterium]|nr:O-antigen ligase family protein [Burkholderiales bacterium]